MLYQKSQKHKSVSVTHRHYQEKGTAVITKKDLPMLLKDTLEQLGGKASLINVCKRFWQEHQDELISSDDLFYTWQYDIRWAATELRKMGIMKSKDASPKGIWELK